MTVSELIKELKKYPKNAEIAWRDHDLSENEINGRVANVDSFNPATSFDPEFCKGIKVVLSP